MRKTVMLVVTGCLAATACSPPEQRSETRQMQKLDVIDASEPPPERASPPPPGIIANRAPGIDVTAAPGVAFNYRYAFRLPNGNIAGVQEAHAAACEKLGIDRCRITGMRYTVADENDVTAMLAFKLDPALARSFGKEGIAAIVKAQGSLVEAAIAGTDTVPQIAGSQRRSDALRARLAMLEASRARTAASDRAELDGEIAQVKAELAAQVEVRDDVRASLATTPMVFEYNSGAALSTSSIGRSWDIAANGFIAALGWMIVALGLTLPWLVVGGGALLLARPLIRRLRARAALPADVSLS